MYGRFRRHSAWRPSACGLGSLLSLGREPTAVPQRGLGARHLLRCSPASFAQGGGAKPAGAGASGGPEPKRRERAGAGRQEAPLPAHRQVPRRRLGALGGRALIPPGGALRPRQNRGRRYHPRGRARSHPSEPSNAPLRTRAGARRDKGVPSGWLGGQAADAHRHRRGGQDAPRRGGRAEYPGPFLRRRGLRRPGILAGPLPSRDGGTRGAGLAGGRGPDSWRGAALPPSGEEPALGAGQPRAPVRGGRGGGGPDRGLPRARRAGHQPRAPASTR